MEEKIRFATTADAEAIALIYKHYVDNTTITLEMQPPDAEEIKKRIISIGAFYPYLVHERDGVVTGYAYASKFQEREGYRYDVSVSVYLAPEQSGKGIGRKLYTKLFPIIEAQGIKNAYAVITYPNEKSVSLNTAFGFENLGLLPHSGYKHGHWVDVLYMGKKFGDMPETPGPLLGVHELPEGFAERILEG